MADVRPNVEIVEITFQEEAVDETALLVVMR